MKRLHGPRGAATLSLEEEKAALRSHMRRTRRRLARGQPQAVETVAEVSLSWTAGVPPADEQRAGETPAVHDRVVAGYTPIGSELDPGALLARLSAENWRVALPRAAARDTALTFHATGCPPKPDAFGIPSPSTSAERLIPDLLLVPMLAFDRHGGRLGQGAGCYDRTIAALRAAGPVWVVGLAYADQEVDHVPGEAHDQTLDAILTETGYREVVKTAS